jgi:signal transduction histidine kinase
MSLPRTLNGRITQLAAGRHLPRRTVRVRLTLLYGGLFLLSGLALVATTYVLFERATAYTQPQLPRVPHAPAIRDLHDLQLLPPLARALPQLAFVQRELKQDQRQLIGAAPNGASAGSPSSFGVPPGLEEDQHQLAQDQHQLAQDQHQVARDVDQLAVAVHQMARAGAAQAAQRAADSHQLLVDSGIALGIVAVLALLAGWLLAGRMLRPVRVITRKAQRISSASLKERLALDGPQDELKELADTLDDLFGRLDAAFEAQRQFVANASHELRAPLTRQRALIQVALADPEASFSSLRDAHERVLAAERHLEQMIDGLLALTRGQAGLERRENVDLAALASRAIAKRGSRLRDHDLDVREALAPAPTPGDPRLLERLVANLIDNAIRHNSPGGHVEITTGTRGRQAFVCIANTGPIVPPDQIQRLFQPFERLDGARTRHDGGHGLGLSIVRAISDAHHAALTADARAEGGLTIEVSFPSAVGPISEVALATGEPPDRAEGRTDVVTSVER